MNRFLVATVAAFAFGSLLCNSVCAQSQQLDEQHPVEDRNALGVSEPGDSENAQENRSSVWKVQKQKLSKKSKKTQKKAVLKSSARPDVKASDVVEPKQDILPQQLNQKLNAKADAKSETLIETTTESNTNASQYSRFYPGEFANRTKSFDSWWLTDEETKGEQQTEPQEVPAEVVVPESELAQIELDHQDVDHENVDSNEWSMDGWLGLDVASDMALEPGVEVNVPDTSVTPTANPTATETGIEAEAVASTDKQAQTQTSKSAVRTNRNRRQRKSGNYLNVALLLLIIPGWLGGKRYIEWKKRKNQRVRKSPILADRARLQEIARRIPLSELADKSNEEDELCEDNLAEKAEVSETNSIEGAAEVFNVLNDKLKSKQIDEQSTDTSDASKAEQESDEGGKAGKAKSPITPQKTEFIDWDRDDLTCLAGINKKIQEALYNAGYSRFGDLERMDNSDLQRVLDECGHTARVWNLDDLKVQASFARRGNWDGLRTHLQEMQQARGTETVSFGFLPDASSEDNPEPVASSSPVSQPVEEEQFDDLTTLPGIDQGTATVLYDNGIRRFEHLAEMDRQQLEELFCASTIGTDFNPGTWPYLAAAAIHDRTDSTEEDSTDSTEEDSTDSIESEILKAVEELNAETVLSDDSKSDERKLEEMKSDSDTVTFDDEVDRNPTIEL